MNRRFGIPSDPIRGPTYKKGPTTDQRHAAERYYLSQLADNPKAVEEIAKMDVAKAKGLVDREYETSFLEFLTGRMGSDHQPTEPGKPHTKTPIWGRNLSLMGNKEVRDYVLNRQKARELFERYLTTMRVMTQPIGYDPESGAFWTPGIFEHEVYFKYILRNHSTDGFGFLEDFSKWRRLVIEHNGARRSTIDQPQRGLHQYTPDGTYKSVMAGPHTAGAQVDKQWRNDEGVQIRPHDGYAHVLNDPAEGVVEEVWVDDEDTESETESEYETATGSDSDSDTDADSDESSGSGSDDESSGSSSDDDQQQQKKSPPPTQNNSDEHPRPPAPPPPPAQILGGAGDEDDPNILTNPESALDIVRWFMGEGEEEAEGDGILGGAGDEGDPNIFNNPESAIKNIIDRVMESWPQPSPQQEQDEAVSKAIGIPETMDQIFSDIHQLINNTVTGVTNEGVNAIVERVERLNDVEVAMGAEAVINYLRTNAFDPALSSVSVVASAVGRLLDSRPSLNQLRAVWEQAIRLIPTPPEPAVVPFEEEPQPQAEAPAVPSRRVGGPGQVPARARAAPTGTRRARDPRSYPLRRPSSHVRRGVASVPATHARVTPAAPHTNPPPRQGVSSTLVAPAAPAAAPPAATPTEAPPMGPRELLQNRADWKANQRNLQQQQQPVVIVDDDDEEEEEAVGPSTLDALASGARGAGSVLASGAGNAARGAGSVLASGARGAGSVLASGAGNASALASGAGNAARGAGSVLASGAGNAARGAGNALGVVQGLVSDITASYTQQPPASDREELLAAVAADNKTRFGDASAPAAPPPPAPTTSAPTTSAPIHRTRSVTGAVPRKSYVGSGNGNPSVTHFGSSVRAAWQGRPLGQQAQRGSNETSPVLGHTRRRSPDSSETSPVHRRRRQRTETPTTSTSTQLEERQRIANLVQAATKGDDPMEPHDQVNIKLLVKQYKQAGIDGDIPAQNTLLKTIGIYVDGWVGDKAKKSNKQKKK